MEEKNKGGRPSKLTEDHIKVFAKIVDEWILEASTNEELFFIYNDELEKEGLQTIAYSTFRNWKNNADQLEHHTKFLALIKKALYKQKKVLLNSLKTDDKSWQRFAWIIERKFSDWNLKQISETKADVNISAFPEFIIKKGTDES